MRASARPPLGALAPAKLNLQLFVGAQRADLYHELDTLMLALDWCDALEFEPSTRATLELEVLGIEPELVPRDASNLAQRAAQRALELWGGEGASAQGGLLRLRKSIPSQAGLGGASSDAAAAFFLLCAAARPALPEAELHAASQRELERLGSDCVFFAHAARTGFARCSGRGERVQILSASERAWHFALIVPRALASTARVYAHFATRLSRAANGSTVEPGMLDGSLDFARARLVNQLEPAALEAVPELGAWRAVLDRIGLQHWRMSGSGASFFGLYEHPGQAAEDLERTLHAAGLAGLSWREARLVRPAGHGVRLV